GVFGNAVTRATVDGRSEVVSAHGRSRPRRSGAGKDGLEHLQVQIRYSRIRLALPGCAAELLHRPRIRRSRQATRRALERTPKRTAPTHVQPARRVEPVRSEKRQHYGGLRRLPPAGTAWCRGAGRRSPKSERGPARSPRTGDCCDGRNLV